MMSEKVKAADAVWITDRSPTKDDGEIVLTWLHDRWTDMHISWVLNGTVWMRQPPPYQPPPPPEPDTSLAASISRRMVRIGLPLPHMQPCGCDDCDDERIIEAARRWDDSMRETTELADAVDDSMRETTELANAVDDSMRETTELADAVADDPDCVGDGWRLLRAGEVIQPGDQFETRHKWYKTNEPGLTHGGTAVRRRRRIEVDE